MSTKRSFTIVHAEVPLAEDKVGRFESTTPRGAAGKAARRLLKDNAAKHSVRFTIQETTRGSQGKSYTYVGLRRKLDEPITVTRAGVEIKISHEYIVRSCKL